MAIKNLTFTTLPASGRNPVDARRAKTVARLEDQKKLFADPNYVHVSKRFVKIDGERKLMEKQRKVFPWFRTAADGSTVLFVRLGGKPIEFEKGKAGIVVGTADKLPAVIDTVIAAVKAGDLDDALAHAQSGRAQPGTKKKAA